MARRIRGEGSVYYDEARDLWVGVVELGEAGGKRRRKVVRARKQGDMLAKLQAAKTQAAKGLPAGDGVATVAGYADYWLTSVLAAKPDTAALYRRWLTDMVLPYVGRIRLAQLGPEHVNTMMRALEAKGLAPGSVALARRMLRRVLAAAEREGRVARNAVAQTDAPRTGRARTSDALDVAGAQAVLDTARGDRLYPLAVLVLTTGLRQGEALRLRWDDLNLRTATLTVVKAKTQAGLRTIAIPPVAVAALRIHKAAQARERMAAPAWADPQLVFANPAGKPITSREILRWWHALTIAAGVGRRRFHASRHTAATLMLNNGTRLEVVSATLGHASLAITSDIYAAVGADLQKTAADAMQTVLGGGGR